MNTRRWLTRALTFCGVIYLGASLMACGYRRPDYETVEKDIENPTGTINAETTGGALGSYNTQGSASPLAGGMVGADKPLRLATVHPTDLGSYLKKAGLSQGLLAHITPHMPLNNDYTYRRASSAQGGLSKKEINAADKCTDANVGFGSSVIRVDLSCTGYGSGTLTIRTVGLLNAGNLLKVGVDFDFSDACDKSGRCVDGVLGIKIAGDALGDSGRIVYAYHLRASRGEKFVETKGGFRLFGSKSTQTARLEVLAYVRHEGQEAAVVLVFAKQGDNASFSVRGKNGEFRCSSKDNGATGKCVGEGVNGAGSFSWARPTLP